MIYIDKRESTNSVRMYSRIGNVAPMHCTAVAKAIVAYLPQVEQERLVSGLDFVGFTERTIGDADDYLAELRRGREHGFFVDHQEHEDFVNCLACPIFAANGEAIGSVSVTTTTLVCTHEELLELAPRMREVAAKISHEFGFMA